jgi:hypothetical protein
MSGSLRQRSFRARLAKLEAPLAGPSVAEIEQRVAFLILLDDRFGRRRGGIGDTEAERAAMRLVRAATTYEERKAAVELWDVEQAKRPYLGKDPAEILSARHKPFRCKEEVA